MTQQDQQHGKPPTESGGAIEGTHMSQTAASPKINTAALDNAANNNTLLDTIIAKLGLKNDAALSRELEVAPPVISKIRHGALPIGATLLIRMHEATDITISELKAIGLRAA